MARIKAVHPKVRMHVVFSQETAAALLLRFRSDTNQLGFMKGAISTFVEQAVKEKLERMKQ